MAGSAQQFHLMVDELSPAVAAGATPDKIEVPPGVSYLTARAGERPQLGQEASDGVFVLETVQGGNQPQLVLVSPAEERARVNGQPVPRVAVLNVKDQVQLNDTHVLHVTLYNCPSVGSPPADIIGKECPICRTLFKADTTVYVCSSCGTPIHLEGEEKKEERLECALLTSECPSCGTPVVMKQGYAYMPELFYG